MKRPGEETRWRNVYVLTFFILIFSDEPENKYDDFDDTPSSKYSYKDDDEEFTSVERTHTTRTEKITTNRRTRSVGKKLDLGASSTLGKDKSDTTVLIIIKSPHLNEFPHRFHGIQMLFLIDTSSCYNFDLFSVVSD